MKSDADFPKIYKFTFNFLKGEEARNVKVEYAIQMWVILLKYFYGESITPFLEKWTEFLEDQMKNKGTNGVKRDEWNSLLDLFKDKGILIEDMVASNEDCWPILFDSFFEYLQSQ